MRIAFFGLPLAALMLARDGHELVWAGICHKRAPGTRRLARWLGQERVHMLPDLGRDEHRASLVQTRPDLIVSWFWTKKIPSWVLGLAPSFGVHPSLLPRHRGADPYFWAIDLGDDVTGVTAHLLEEEYDTGPIIEQRTVQIDSTWNAWRLARALDRPSLELVRDVASAFARGTPLACRPQNERAATLALQPTERELAIRWGWPATRIERRVRAAAPWPGAWTEIGETVVTLECVRPTRDFPRALQPGEAAVRADGVAVVRAGEDALELVLARSEDDRPLSPGDLAALVERTRKVSIFRRSRATMRLKSNDSREARRG